MYLKKKYLVWYKIGLSRYIEYIFVFELLRKMIFLENFLDLCKVYDLIKYFGIWLKWLLCGKINVFII